MTDLRRHDPAVVAAKSKITQYRMYTISDPVPSPSANPAYPNSRRFLSMGRADISILKPSQVDSVPDINEAVSASGEKAGL